MPDPIWHPSPNFGARRGVEAPDLVVLHYTAMVSAEKARDWLCNPKAEVSAHYVIGRKGTIWQLVREEDRAWHAGAGSWGGVTDVNSRSIGIEIANTGAEPFSEPQMASLEGLLAGILRRWTIPAHHIVGHSDTALGRKIDPGPHFDWRRLARRGLAVWPEPAERAGPFDEDAACFGYDKAPDDSGQVLNAFRLRFRPWAKGAADETDARLMASLAKHWPKAT